MTDAPTRIALFASSFHPHKGGVEELVRQLAHAQQEAGLEPTVVTMRWPKSLPAHDWFEGLAVDRFVFRTPELPAKRLAAALVLGPATLASLVWRLRKLRSQVVHIQCVSPASWYAMQAARILRLRLVVTMQGELTMDATGLYQRSLWARRTLRLVLRHADAISACSAHTLSEAEDWYGTEFAGRATVIHNGVDADEIAGAPPHRDDAPYVFAIGRLVRQKGFDVLLDAFARLVESPGFEHRLLLAGDGPERPALEKQASDLGITGRVHLLGATDRSTTASLFRGADAFVLPSRHEPFGIVVLEAMAAGVPVVATDVGGVAEFLPDGPTTRLCPPDDPASLAAEIERALSVGPPDAAATASSERAVGAHSWTTLERAYARCYASSAG